MRSLRSLAAAALVLPLLLVAVPVGADHVYSHRYIVQGRVIDDAGDPVQGADVTIDLQGWPYQDEHLEGAACQGEQGPGGPTRYVRQTDQFGDYRVCVHVHALLSAGKVVVTVGNVTEEAKKDRATRMSFVHVTIPAGSAGAVGNVEAFGSFASLRGRIWRDIGGTEDLEGIPVTGSVIANRQFTVQLELADGTTVEPIAQPQANGYGEFNVGFETEADLEDAIFHVTVVGHEEEIEANAAFRATDTVIKLPEAEDSNGSPAPGVLALVTLMATCALFVAVRGRS